MCGRIMWTVRFLPIAFALSPGAVLAGDIPTFSDQTNAAGLAFTHNTTESSLGEPHFMTPGVAVGDFNRDGYLDLFVQGGKGQNAKLFINNGDGTFTDQAARWGIDLTEVEGSCASVADIDGNGYLDIYAGSIEGRNHLYVNTGHGGFIETGVASGAALVNGLPFQTYGATFGDVDLDGDLDLVTAQWRAGANGNLLFLNDGNGTFTESTVATGVYTAPVHIFGFAPVLVDLNGDRYPELLVAADFGTSQYHANLGLGTFIRLLGNGTCTDENGMGSALADYDNDGDLDWFVTSIFDDDGVAEGSWGITGNRLYRNDGNHQFTDVTNQAGVRNGFWGWGASFADFNNDGLLDLAMTNGFLMPGGFNPDPTFETDPTRLWINTGDFAIGPTYIEVADQAGLVHTGPGKGLVTFDSDNDGDLDIVITTNQGDLKYFRNDTNPASNTWIELDVIPPPGDAPDGIGATIDLTVDGKTYHRAVFGSPSFMSQDPLRVHFGFPAASVVNRLVIRWANGTSTVRTHLSTGRIMRLRSSDLDGDGSVGVSDLRDLLAAWGPCTSCDLPWACSADLDDDCTVGVTDLLIVLANWGTR